MELPSTNPIFGVGGKPLTTPMLSSRSTPYQPNKMCQSAFDYP